MDLVELLRRPEGKTLEFNHIVPRLVPELEILPWRRTHLLAV